MQHFMRLLYIVIHDYDNNIPKEQISTQKPRLHNVLLLQSLTVQSILKVIPTIYKICLVIKFALQNIKMFLTEWELIKTL